MPYIGNQPGTGVRSRFIYTATASQTTFSGADDNSKTLKYADSAYVDVFLNGVCLVPGTDYTASTKTSVVLTQAASVSDTLEVIAYDVASMADTVSKADGGTFEDGITIRTADNTAQLTLESTDDDAGIGPHQVYYRNSSSPADNDLLAEIDHRGRNDNSQDVDYATVNIFAEDVSDGTEDGKYLLQTMKAGAAVSRMDVNSTETVFNDDSKDIDFRIESDNDANAFFVHGSDGKVGIGLNNPTDYYGDQLVVNTPNEGGITMVGPTTSENYLMWADGTSGGEAYRGYIGYSHATNTIRFGTNSSEGMRIDSTGNVLIGKTSTSSNTAGIRFSDSAGYVEFTRSGGNPLYLNRQSSDGSIIRLDKDGSKVMTVGTTGGQSYIHGVNGETGWYFGANNLYPYRSTGFVDNTTNLAHSGTRFKDAFIANGVTTTSDEREKQQIALLTDKEITAAKAISKLFKTYKWNDAVAAKGDNARTHTGVVAQQVEAAMSDAGLDAGDYGFFMSDTWWEKQTEVAAVDAEEEKDIEAQDAYTRTDHYDTKDEAPEGATERNRKGIRYPELLAFIGAATEQRLTSIEARLTALEAE